MKKKFSLKGTLEILLIAQRYQFDDVIKRCSDHLKHTINSAILSSDGKIKEVNIETMNSLLIARCKHLGLIFKIIKIIIQMHTSLFKF